MICRLVARGSRHVPEDRAIPAAGVAGLVLGFAVIAHADTVVVTADRMIDVLTGRGVDHPQVTIVDGRISAVGSTGAVVPADARRIDLAGALLQSVAVVMKGGEIIKAPAR
jgi:hypothetical protein